MRFAALAGMTGAVLFVSVFTIEGWLRPGYDPLSMYVSALSIGPRGWVQMINFIVTGVLLLVFAWGAAVTLNNGKTSQAAFIPLGINAIGILLSGPFIMDPMGTSPAHASLHGLVHGILGGIVFLMMPFSCFAFFRRFGADTEWQSFKRWTLTAGVVISAALTLFTLSSKVPIGQHIFRGWFGLLQRGVLIPYMFWLFTFALALYRRS